jgi:hypothetical protein
MTGSWPVRFEVVLRQYLAELADGFGPVLDGEALDPALFATPARSGRRSARSRWTGPGDHRRRAPFRGGANMTTDDALPSAEEPT